jgi:hypothetical protein
MIFGGSSESTSCFTLRSVKGDMSRCNRDNACLPAFQICWSFFMREEMAFRSSNKLAGDAMERLDLEDLVSGFDVYVGATFEDEVDEDNDDGNDDG